MCIYVVICIHLSLPLTKTKQYKQAKTRCETHFKVEAIDASIVFLVIGVIYFRFV